MHEINSNNNVALAVPPSRRSAMPRNGCNGQIYISAGVHSLKTKPHAIPPSLIFRRKFLSKKDMDFLGWEERKKPTKQPNKNSFLPLATGVVQSSQGVVSWPVPRSSLPAPPGGKKDVRAIALGIGLGSKGTGIQFLLLPFCMSAPPRSAWHWLASSCEGGTALHCTGK